jgi:Holliday junction resolvase RusA-like endonuclease
MIEIHLPWPPAGLSPNVRSHHMALYKAKKLYKEECIWVVKKAGLKPIKAQRLDVLFTFYKPSKRKMDVDNLVARMKAGIDAISDVTQVDDSNWSMRFEIAPTLGNFVKVEIITL